MTNVVSVLGVNKKYVVIPSQYKCQQGWIEIVRSYDSYHSYITVRNIWPRPWNIGQIFSWFSVDNQISINSSAEIGQIDIYLWSVST